MSANAYHFWLTNPYFDEPTRKELEGIAGNAAEIEDRFYRHLEFGTGGLRGVIGAGTNRINKYVVRQATCGLGDYISTFGPRTMAKGVVIAYDSRHFSREFAVEAALVLAGLGIKAYVFESMRPTPELSFAVRHLSAAAGIVVTASHNPPQYNGYKVYWEDGGQIPPERADGILERIEQISDITRVLPMDMAQAAAEGLYVEIGEELDRQYLDKIKSLVINPEIIREMGAKCKILYSPLHGTGSMLIPRVLAELGFNQVQVVPEQALPDPNFSTVKTPNPEEPAAFNLALQMAKEQEPDVIMATDPDADRIGVVVKDDTGSYRLLSGNQTGVLLTYYILSQLWAKNALPSDGVIVKTIVSTDMVLAIAKDFQVAVDQTLTGFKFIGEKIHQYEQAGDKTFLFGFEESYGYLAGTFVRDKDAVCAAVLIAEAAAFFKSQGKTLYAVMEELWARYGYYRETLHTITLEGKTGKEETDFLMQEIRRRKLVRIAEFNISQREDYQSGKGYELSSGEEYTLTLPKSDVVLFRLAQGGYIVFRPSGTEPKAKVYISLAGSGALEAEQTLARVKEEVIDLVKQILRDFAR